jgi:hypothetical protein
LISKLRRVLRKAKKIWETFIRIVLFAFEQLAYLEFLGAEYMAFETCCMYGEEKEKEE